MARNRPFSDAKQKLPQRFGHRFARPAVGDCPAQCGHVVGLLRGVATLVLEPLAAPSQELKAGGVNVITVDAFERRGLGQALYSAAADMAAGFLPNVETRRGGGHFAGLFGRTWRDTGEPATARADLAGPGRPARRRGPTRLCAGRLHAGRARRLTIEFDGPPRDRLAPVTAQELETSLRRLSGQDVKVTAVTSATRWTDNARQATTYRMGRVLLAGDAAHVHSPFGGLGLNLGIGDTMNLGWKLAATVRGTGPAHLLDTYTAERHPIGERVLQNTRAQLALMRPGPHVDALRDIVSDVMDTDQGNAFFTKMITGLTHTYASGGHPLVGRRAPDLVLADGRKLMEAGAHRGRAPARLNGFGAAP